MLTLLISNLTGCQEVKEYDGTFYTSTSYTEYKPQLPSYGEMVTDGDSIDGDSGEGSKSSLDSANPTETLKYKDSPLSFFFNIEKQEDLDKIVESSTDKDGTVYFIYNDENNKASDFLKLATGTDKYDYNKELNAIIIPGKQVKNNRKVLSPLDSKISQVTQSQSDAYNTDKGYYVQTESKIKIGADDYTIRLTYSYLNRYFDGLSAKVERTKSELPIYPIDIGIIKSGVDIKEGAPIGEVGFTSSKIKRGDSFKDAFNNSGFVKIEATVKKNDASFESMSIKDLYSLKEPPAKDNNNK